MFKFLAKIIRGFFDWIGGLFGGDTNERELKKLQPIVDRINSLETEFQKLTNEELRGKTSEFRQRLIESVANKKAEIDDVKKELAEAQNCINTVEGFDQKAEISVQCKRLQDNTLELDKELRKQENEFLDDILPEAFAAVREAARRTIHQRHFNVQLMGGIVLHHGRIAEMRTGEGKTLVATLPLYLNSLTGRGVHLVTVNDYLARRDPYWMGPVFHSLGVSVSSIYPMQSEAERLPSRLYDPDYDSGKENDPWRHFKPVQRKEAYGADITYGTSAEFGFDYLRDNMAVDLNQTVQRDQNFAIVDEADSLLIDEARTPLIISAPGEKPSEEYYAIAQLARKLKGKRIDPSDRHKGLDDYDKSINENFDYEYDEKNKTIILTQKGQETIARMLHEPLLFEDKNLSNQIGDVQNLEEPKSRTETKQRIENALRAEVFFKLDHQYILKEGKVLIVDEFTGRILVGRRYSEGLHQAIEAKENVKVEAENKTFATVTIQNYFRMYAKMAGMTGTAVTEAEEFSKIYKLEVVVIPTDKPPAREDFGDLIFKNEESKFKALVKEVEETQKLGRPVLVGTVAVENSEVLSEMLKRRGVKHNVLNANPKRTEPEADIISQAGEPGTVTVATNMAGRGVDIILGGKPPEDGNEKAMAEWKARHDKVVELGGLHVLGSERHEARRIDNQLRGRAGRQGDPGSSRFYVALDDELMRRFGGERIQNIMNWAGMDENTPIENKLISRSIENAQTKVEGYNFDIRKHLVDYDDVINKQREIIYGERHKILTGADLRSNILDMVKSALELEVDRFLKVSGGEEPDFAGLIGAINNIFLLPPEMTPETLAQMPGDGVLDTFTQLAEELYSKKEDEVGPATMRILERLVMLRVVDTLWVDHLTDVDYMRQGIGIQASAQQQDPLVAYKRQSSLMFDELLAGIRHDVARYIFHVSVSRPGVPGASNPAPIPSSPMTKIMGKPGENKNSLPGKPGRNEPCPCGSGKKYKHCCGK